MEYKWVDFHKELAQKLLLYKDNRKELIERIPRIFYVAGVKMPTLEMKGSQILDIDPFTIFGFFNKGLTFENRRRICKGIAEVFEMTTPIPESFDGVPLVFKLGANFYPFKDERQEHDIDNLWGLFESALKYSAEPSRENREEVIKYFDLSVNIKYSGNGKITMGLFWIDPNAFINLDSRNRWYIYASGRIPQDVVDRLPHIDGKLTGEQYFTLLEMIREYLQSDRTELKDFKDLSYDAWTYSQQVNEENKGRGFDAKEVEPRGVHYWIYAPGKQASEWDKFYNAGIMAINFEGGDLRNYSSKKAISDKLVEEKGGDSSHTKIAYTSWQFVHEMELGDVVFVKNGLHKIVGRGIVEGDYEFDENRESFQHIRKMKWTHKGEWEFPEKQAALSRLTDITDKTERVEKIKAFFVDNETGEVAEEINKRPIPEYTSENFFNDVLLNDKKDYDTLIGLLKYKKNLILQGAPGVGKTYIAKRLAYSMMGKKDESRVAMVQFHQSYSYEDFIMGIRPVMDDDGDSRKDFELKEGVFYEFCKKAEEDNENDYFFIIDEINRGNISKIFGELFMLVESDKRGKNHKLQLLYQKEQFSIPENLYIIGTMNTADRSLAMIDYALRRRFAFYDIEPVFESPDFDNYAKDFGNEKFGRVIEVVKEINKNIEEDDSLGKGFRIGHSYFCFTDDDMDKFETGEENLDDRLDAIVKYELIPLIEEYWFDDKNKVEEISKKLRDAIK